MAESEGVIKYQLEFHRHQPVADNLDELNAWRSILHGLRLIGQDESRYQGYAYGNLSKRSSSHPNRFIVSGSQTGGLAQLEQQHYVLIEQCDIESNRVVARGPLEPSSEALTHAMIYSLDQRVQCVLHVHDAVLWRYGLDSELPSTDAATAYGTPGMAREVASLYAQGQLSSQGVLVMAGHQDGVICFGDSIYQAGKRLLKLWVDAWVDRSARSNAG